MSSTASKIASKPRVSPRRRALLARLHIAKKELGLDEDTYRAALMTIAGASSARDLSDEAIERVLAEFRRRGWRPGRARSARFSHGARGGRRWRPRAKYAHCRKVWALWGELKRHGIWRDPNPASLVKFVRRLTGVDDPDWLTPAQSNKVIEALKDIGHRAGIEWD